MPSTELGEDGEQGGLCHPPAVVVVGKAGAVAVGVAVFVLNVEVKPVAVS